MEETELTEIYTELVRVLEAYELRWVVDQVSEQARLGKTATKEVKPLHESVAHERQTPPLLASPRPMRSGRKATFTTAAEYTPRERLLLLVGAIEQSVIVTADIEYEIIESVGREVKDSEPRIVFEPEDGVQGRFGLTTEAISSRKDYAQTLKRLLDELCREVSHAD